MKNRFLLLSLVVVLGTAPGARAEDAKPAAGADHATGKPEKPETELEKTMTKMGKAWRQVRKASREGTLSPATAEAVATVRTNAMEASKLTPALEAEQPAAEQAKFHSDYQAQLKKLIATLTSLETALKANDTTTATKLVGDVGELMKAGHKEFKKPDEPGHS